MARQRRLVFVERFNHRRIVQWHNPDVTKSDGAAVVLQKEWPGAGFQEMFFNASQIVGDAMFIGNVGGSWLFELNVILDFFTVEPCRD